MDLGEADPALSCNRIQESVSSERIRCEGLTDFEKEKKLHPLIVCAQNEGWEALAKM